jgi:hypothetical protein
VTNSTWEHFWLNEGWTVWLERKILARTKGEEHLKLSAQIGWKHLKDDVALLGADSGFTSLVWPLGGEDPDDAFSAVPYEKGFNLLYQLEHLMGAEAFGCFAKAYIQRFKYSTVTTGDFRDYFVEYFTLIWDPLTPSDADYVTVDESLQDKDSTNFVSVPESLTDDESVPATVVKFITNLLTPPSSPSRLKKTPIDAVEAAHLQKEARSKLSDINWVSLFHTKGMPSDPVPSFDNSLARAAETLSQRWVGLESTIGLVASATKGTQQPSFGFKGELEDWSTQQVNLFLEFLLTHADEEAPFSEALLLALDESYGFTNSNNAEIRFRWQSLCLRSDVPWIVPQVVAFLTSQGRMKYVRPLYRALKQSTAGRQVALDTFKKFKDM